jgi:hypothetical protein
MDCGTASARTMMRDRSQRAALVCTGVTARAYGLSWPIGSNLSIYPPSPIIAGPPPSSSWHWPMGHDGAARSAQEQEGVR